MNAAEGTMSARQPEEGPSAPLDDPALNPDIPSPILDVQRLSLWYGESQALHDVGLKVAEKQITAFNNRYWSLRVDQPIASLTVQVYTYAISPYDDWHRQAWAGATVLIGAVLLFSVLARLATRRLQRMHRG